MLLKVGDRAPDFTLPDQDGKAVTLSAFLGKKNVVLAFYVLANTPTWTRELKAYQAGLAKFEKADTQILGLSINKPSTNKGFAKKMGITFPLLSDTEKKISRQYGVLNFFRVASRTTFVIDKAGMIRHIDRGSAAADPAGASQACEVIAGSRH